MEYVAEVSDIYYTFVLELLFTHGGSYTCHLPMAGIFMPVHSILYGGFVPPCGVLMHPLPSQGETQRESGTFFVYKFSSFLEKVPFPVFYWSIVIVLFK